MEQNYYVIENADEMEKTVKGSCLSLLNGYNKRPRYDEPNFTSFYNSINYPIGLAYYEPWDSHCCGTFREVELKTAVIFEMERLEDIVKKCNKYHYRLKEYLKRIDF